MNDKKIREEAIKIASGLFPHQVEGIAFLMGRRRAILADDMGLGKTRQAVVAATHLEPVGPYLVVCPASVKQNWVREIEAVELDAETAIVGPASPPATDWAGWVIINYDILERHFETLSSREWKAIVFDEAHYMKNYRSKRSRLGRKLVEEGQTHPIVFALTGTPLTNRPRDLFPLLQVTGHSMGRSFLTFAKRYCDATHNGYGWVTDGASNIDELALQLHGLMMRRTKNEVLDLPPKLRTWLNVTVPEGTARVETADIVSSLMAEHLRGSEKQLPTSPEIGSGADGESRIRLLGKLARARRRLAEAKVRTTIEFIENALEQEEKVLVFSCFTAPIERIQRKFKEVCVTLTGKTPQNKRQGIVDRFQEDDSVRVMAANIIAGGIGLNLTAARQVVFNDLDWVPTNHWQAEDRAYRIGQTGTVQVTYMVADETIDTFVRAVLETKATLSDAIVEGEALPAFATSDIFSDLVGLMESLRSSGTRLKGEVSEENVGDWVREAQKEFQVTHPIVHVGRTTRVESLPAEALDALIRALSGPESKRYRVASKSGKGKFYEIEQSGPDLICSCPGFEYRGTCRHTKDLKEALVKSSELPDGVEEVV